MSVKNLYRGLESKFRKKNEYFFYDKFVPYQRECDFDYSLYSPCSFYLNINDPSNSTTIRTGYYVFEGVGRFDSGNVDCTILYAFFKNINPSSGVEYIAKTSTYYGPVQVNVGWDGNCPGTYTGPTFINVYNMPTQTIGGIEYPQSGTHTTLGKTYTITYTGDCP